MIPQRSFSKPVIAGPLLSPAKSSSKIFQNNYSLSLQIPNLSTAVSTASKLSTLASSKTPKSPKIAHLSPKESNKETFLSNGSDSYRYFSSYTRASTRFPQNTARPFLENHKTLSPRFVSISEKYSTLGTETTEDGIKESGLQMAIKVLNKFLHSENTTAYSVQGKRKTSSIKLAKRVMTIFLENLKALIKPKTNRDLNSPDRKATTSLETEIYILFEKMNSMINQLTSCCEQVQGTKGSKPKLNLLLREIYDIGQKSGNAEMALYCFYLQGKIYFTDYNFVEATTHFKQLKELSLVQKSIWNRLTAYKWLGKCYQEEQKYKAALCYFIKFLQIAWFLNSGKHELLAYDYIGLQYYYLGELEKAKHYHLRMVKGYHEPENSNVKHIGIKKVKLAMEKEHTSYRVNRERRRGTLIPGIKIQDPQYQEDELDEVSSKDEDFELPINTKSHQEDKLESKENGTGATDGNEDGNKPNTAVFVKKKIPKILDIMRVKIAKIAKDKAKEKQNYEWRKESFSFLNSDKPGRLSETRTIAMPSGMNGKPNEPMFVCHLSRNRQLKNFLGLSPRGIEAATPEDFARDFNQNVDAKSHEKVKKIFEKFRINLLVMRNTLQRLEKFF